VNISIRSIIQSTIYKTITLGIMIAFVIGCFSYITYKFKTTDSQPQLQPIVKKIGKEFTFFPAKVDVGLLIKNFTYFNIVENKLTANVLVWFKFNPEETSLATIENFSFENGKILKKSPPDIKKDDDKILAKFYVLVELNCALNYHKFPIEDHKLSFLITNNFVTPYEVVFNVENSNFVISPDVSMTGWKIVHLTTSYGVDEDPLGRGDSAQAIKKPKAAFTIDIEKKGIRKAFIIFVPIFFAFFFSLLSLFLSLQNIVGRVKLSGASVGALLTYRFVIEGMMPKVGYFTTADYIYGVLIASAFTIFVIQVVLTNLFNKAVKVVPPHHEAVKIKATKPLAAKLAQLNLVKDATFAIITIASTIALVILILI